MGVPLPLHIHQSPSPFDEKYHSMKLNRKTNSLTVALLTFCSLVGGANAANTIGFANITPSTTLTAVGGFPLSEIVDGITGSDTNGFVSNSVGIISFTFDQDYDLSSFILWNDVDVQAEGIDDFELRFFDAGNSQISVPFSTGYTGPVGQVAPEEYVFSSSVSGVRRVDLEVLTTQFNFPGPVPRIEIREVDFGVIPEPSSALLMGLGALGVLMCRRRLK